MSEPVYGDFKTYLAKMQEIGPGKKEDPRYPYVFAVLTDHDFLEAVNRGDDVAARNALTCILLRVYGPGGTPKQVAFSARVMGARIL